MEKLLDIVKEEHDIQIDENKLRKMLSQKSVWDFYGIPRSRYVLLSSDEKTVMLKK